MGARKESAVATDRVPTEQDLAALPLWARVAFAARCARRVLPLYRAAWPDAPAEHVAALQIAVGWGEGAAAVGGGRLLSPVADRSRVVNKALKAREAAPDAAISTAEAAIRVAAA